MICEIAQLEVMQGKEAEFKSAIDAAIPLFKRARGCQGLRVMRSQEFPSRYWLIVDWISTEDHTVHFRTSPDHAEWHRLVRPFFSERPKVEHAEVIAESIAP
jgi:heme-degrading monooxygenase HmoA